MVTYTDSIADVTPAQLQGFFVGWPNPPTPATHLRILAGSYAAVLARDDSGAVVGFITAISDGVSAAYIPHLEVLPAYQGQGIGSELVRRMLTSLGRPAVAFATIALFGAAGAGTGVVMLKQSETERGELAYLETVNPLVRPHSEVEP